MRVRIVPTASGKKAIQVVSKRNGKVKIHKHIGSYSNEEQKAKLLKQAEKFITETYRSQRLICEYSQKRAAKDKSDRLKQVAKAQTVISTPSQATRRFRFLKQKGSKLTLNAELVKKSRKAGRN